MPVFQWFTLVKARGLHPFWELLKILADRSNNQAEALEIDSTPILEEQNSTDDEDDRSQNKDNDVATDNEDQSSQSSSSEEEIIECIYCNKKFDTEIVFKKHEKYCGK